MDQRETNTALFDARIYAQEGARSPPQGITLPALPTTRPQRIDEPRYLHIDPRIHYPQQHSEDWHAAKQAEIKARGPKKANFGQALCSLRRQRQSRGWETPLPNKILENPDWVKALTHLGATVGDLTVGDREVGVKGRQHDVAQ